MEKRFFASALLSVVAVLVTACGGTKTTVIPPPTITVGITAQSPTVPAAGTDSITPTAEGGTTNTVNLAMNPSNAGTLSASTNVASGTPVIFTAGSPTSATQVTITATSTEDSTKSKSVTITVSAVVVTPPTITSVTVTANPTSVATGATSQCSAVVAGTGSFNSAVTWTATGGTITSAGLFTAGTTAGNGSCKATSVEDSTQSGTAAIAITSSVPPPTGTVKPSATTIVAGSSLTLTTAIANANNGCTVSASDGSVTNAPITCNGTAKFTPTATSGTVTYTVTASGTGGSATFSSGAITINVSSAITLTKVSPRAQFCVGECFLSQDPFITLTGTNFVPGDVVATTPDSNVQYELSTLTGSTEWKVSLAIDENHEGSGDRSVAVTEPDGTGSSATLPFGLYGQISCREYHPTGEMFCLGAKSVYKYTKTGMPDGSFSVGGGRCCMAVDDTTGFVWIDATAYDQNGGQTTTPWLTGLPSGNPGMANAAGNGLACIGQIGSKLNISCGPLTASSTSPTQFISTTVGSGIQSMEIAVVNNKTRLFVFTTGGDATLWSIDISDGQSGMANPISHTISDFTAGVPQGSGFALLNSTGILASFGDGLAVPFDLGTLAPADAISVPGLPVSIVAAGDVALVGIANPTAFGGTMSVLDPTKATITAIPSDASSALPVGPSVDIPSNTFWVCPTDGSSACNSFTLP